MTEDYIPEPRVKHLFPYIYPQSNPIVIAKIVNPNGYQNFIIPGPGLNDLSRSLRLNNVRFVGMDDLVLATEPVLLHEVILDAIVKAAFDMEVKTILVRIDDWDGDPFNPGRQQLADKLGVILADWETSRDDEDDTPSNRNVDEWSRPITRPFDQLSTTGLLWLINTTVFHPRGYALTVVYEAGTDTAIGWAIQGNGLEPLEFPNGDNGPDFSAATEFLSGDHGSYPGKADPE